MSRRDRRDPEPPSVSWGPGRRELGAGGAPRPPSLSCPVGGPGNSQARCGEGSGGGRGQVTRRRVGPGGKGWGRQRGRTETGRGRHQGTRPEALPALPVPASSGTNPGSQPPSDGPGCWAVSGTFLAVTGRSRRTHSSCQESGTARRPTVHRQAPAERPARRPRRPGLRAAGTCWPGRGAQEQLPRPAGGDLRAEDVASRAAGTVARGERKDSLGLPGVASEGLGGSGGGGRAGPPGWSRAW